MLHSPGFKSRQGQEIFLFFKKPRPALGPTQAHFSISTPERSEREVDKTLPPSAGIKNKWSHAATSYRPS